MIELQRQSLIESLIGMGFPIDWALRAVVSQIEFQFLIFIFFVFRLDWALRAVVSQI